MVQTSDGVLLELIALRLLSDADKPVGAVRLMQAWRAAGLPGAEATAGRFLRQLDELGFTELLGNTRGRTLTPAGAARLQSLIDQQRQLEQQSQLWNALTATDLSDLMDLLRMRRLVEVEAARLAASRASAADLTALAAVAHHRHGDELPADTTSPSMDFHRLVARSCHNRIVGAVALLLLDPTNDPLEKMLEHISFEAGATQGQLSDHAELVRAIEHHRADDAAAIMARHMDKLIEAVERYRQRDQPRNGERGFV
jgi:DNA-binding FadR family transcriptional regulator